MGFVQPESNLERLLRLVHQMAQYYLYIMQLFLFSVPTFFCVSQV